MQGTSVRMQGRVHALLATEEHADALAAFYRIAWGGDVTAESILASRRRAAAENTAKLGEPPPTVIVLEGDRVIGHCGSIAQRLWDGVAEHPAYWVKGLMVLPEYRSGPVGFLAVKELSAQLPRAAALVVAPAARRLFSALGYADLGALPNWVRPLRAARLAQRLDVAGLGLGLPRWLVVGTEIAKRVGLARLAGAAAGAALDLAAAATRRPARRFATACAPEPPSREDLDDVWHATRRGLGASPVRDGLYLRWRFGHGAEQAGGNPYEFVTARDRERLVGVAVVRRPRAIGDPRLRGLQLSTISDLVYSPERADVGLALLSGVARAARTAGADAILSTTSHRALAPLLRRQGYVRIPGNVHFLMHDRTAGARWPSDVGSWWLVRGDSGADDVF